MAGFYFISLVLNKYTYNLSIFIKIIIMNFYKNFIHALPVLFLSFFLILTGCDKNDDTDNSLPPATQTETFLHVM